MEYKRIFKDGIHLFAGKLGTVIISIVDMMILARILTTEQMGKYSLFLMIVNLVLIIGLNWSDTSIVRHGREEYIKYKKVNQSFWARMYLFVPIIILFIIIFVIFRKQITNYIGISEGLIILIIIMFIVNGLLNFIKSLCQSVDQMKKSAYIQLCQKAFYLILLFVALAFFKSNLTVVLVLINLSFLITLTIYTAKFDFSKIKPYVFNKEQFKRIWKYSWPQLIGFPGIYVINYVDIFVIKKYMTLSDVGVYNMAYNVFSNISLFIMIIYTVCMPLIVEYRTAKKFQLIKSYLKKTPIFTAIWISMVIIGLLLSKYIIPIIFSSKYAESVPSLNILLIASIFYFVSIYLLPIVNAFDLILYSQIINIIRAAVNIAGDFILVPKMGIIGAAYGTLIAYFVGLLLNIILLVVKRKEILEEA